MLLVQLLVAAPVLPVFAEPDAELPVEVVDNNEKENYYRSIGGDKSHQNNNLLTRSNNGDNGHVDMYTENEQDYFYGYDDGTSSRATGERLDLERLAEDERGTYVHYGGAWEEGDEDDPDKEKSDSQWWEEMEGAQESGDRYLQFGFLNLRFGSVIRPTQQTQRRPTPVRSSLNNVFFSPPKHQCLVR
jgi:hypothetical protein